MQFPICLLFQQILFLSRHGCFCSIINANSFGNSSSCLKCRPRYLRLLVLLLEAVQILCSSFFIFVPPSCAWAWTKDLFFFFISFLSFYNKTLSQSRQIFQFIFLNLVTFDFSENLEMWENPNTETTCGDRFPLLRRAQTQTTGFGHGSGGSASRLQNHAIKAAWRRPRTTRSLERSLHNPASVLEQPFGFFYHSCRQLSTLYGRHWSRRRYCFVLSSFVCFMVPF